MAAQTPELLRQVVSTTGEKLWTANYVWDPNALDWVAMTQPGSSAGGGGATTIADGGDVTQGAKADAAWDGSALAPTAQAILKYLGAKLEAVRALLAGTLTIGGAVSVSNFPVSQAVTGPLTDTQLRASAVPISAAALPLPTGAATSAAQTTGNTSLGSIDTKLDVALSTRLKPADTLAGITTVAAVTTITNAVTVNDLTNAPATAKGTQGTKGVPTQDLKDAGRTYVVITLDAVAGITVEALATLAINKGGSVVGHELHGHGRQDAPPPLLRVVGQEHVDGRDQQPGARSCGRRGLRHITDRRSQRMRHRRGRGALLGHR